MKNSIRIVTALCLFLGSFFSSKSQSTYTITNSTDDVYYVNVDIAEGPVECVVYASNRSDYDILLTPDGCSQSLYAIQLTDDEWVYKVQIFDFNGCSTSCSPTGGRGSLVATLEPCVNNPATASWNTCSNDNAESNRKTYLDIKQ